LLLVASGAQLAIRRVEHEQVVRHCPMRPVARTAPHFPLLQLAAGLEEHGLARRLGELEPDRVPAAPVPRLQVEVVAVALQAQLSPSHGKGLCAPPWRRQPHHAVLLLRVGGG
jgi:hypothetical protein